ncbi:hypothetical protein [Rhodopila sp.]|uniref:hypothetical protein n=1 Tax=Rhodopila sp. TaxID=2480087 RepID=UPI003D0D8917
MITREPIMRALKQRLTDNLPEFNTISRRFRLPENVTSPEMPALFIVEPSETHVQSIEGLPDNATIDISLYLYTNAGLDPNEEPITTLNLLIDKVAAALTSDAPPPFDQVCTLGGMVQHCWIEGTLAKDPGDLEGVGLARIPLKIQVP